MDSTTLSQVVQMVITILTTVASLWAIIENALKRRNIELESKIDARMSAIEYKVNTTLRNTQSGSYVKKDENI